MTPTLVSVTVVSAASQPQMFSFLDKENNEGKWKDNKWCWPHVVPQVSHMNIHIVYVVEKK